MATHKSAEKKMKQDTRRRIRNRTHLSHLRTKIKKFRSLLEQKDISAAEKLFPETIALIDKSVFRGIIHRNTAARYKSNLTSHLRQLSKKVKESR
ncbi:MAG: 30S ribosomal protein S20 [Acidobacteriota bacterium]